MEGVRQITPHLSRLGVTTTVASLDRPDAPWLLNQPFKAIGLGPVVGNYGYRRGLPVCIRDLAFQHDVVIIEGIWQYHAVATWRAVRGTAIPYFVYTHGMLDPWFKRTYPFKHLKKWSYWPWADYRVLRDANAVLFTTDEERRLAQQSFWLYKANEQVVGYGTSAPPPDADYQRYSFLQRYPHLQGKRILLFLSRIHPKKGVDMLIEAFSALAPIDQNLHLIIAGPDQVGWQASLQQRVCELGIADRVTWPGMLTGELKWGAFRSAELFCLPSHQENFGIVVAEALSCGLPVSIAEPVNLAADVKSAGAGLVHADTAVSTQLALQQWLAMSPDEKLLMKKKALELFVSRYDFTSVSVRLFEVLNKLHS